MNSPDQGLSSRLLLVGKVIRPHGSRGLLRIWSYSGSGDCFLEAGRVYLRAVSDELCEFEVISVTPHKNLFLMALEGVGSLNEAEALRGANIYLEKEALPREEDEYFWQDLLGLHVYADTGVYVGRISEIISAKGHDSYIVKEGKKEVIIPATYEVVREIDLANRKMVISAMEGLLELNEV